jgi:hypothetical protein
LSQLNWKLYTWKIVISAYIKDFKYFKCFEFLWYCSKISQWKTRWDNSLNTFSFSRYVLDIRHLRPDLANYRPKHLLDSLRKKRKYYNLSRKLRKIAGHLFRVQSCQNIQLQASATNVKKKNIKFSFCQQFFITKLFFETFFEFFDEFFNNFNFQLVCRGTRVGHHCHKPQKFHNRLSIFHIQLVKNNVKINMIVVKPT